MKIQSVSTNPHAGFVAHATFLELVSETVLYLQRSPKQLK